MPDQLILYHYDSCFYCMRVRQAAVRLGIELELRNVHHEPQHHSDLIEATGRRTVPVLRIESNAGTEWMPESADIVRYLTALAGDPTPAQAPGIVERVAKRLKRGS